MKGKVLLLAIIMIPFFGFNQKIKLLSGDPSALANETAFNVEIDFSKATFYKEKMSEEKYINKRVTEITKDKGAAEAENWQNDWELTRNEKMYNEFIHAIEKKGKKDVTFSKDGDAKYTLIIQVDWIDPGWFAAVSKKPSILNSTLIFVETANPDKVILKLSCLKAPGDQYPMGIPNTNNRIAKAFDAIGVGLGGYMKKKFK